jgi:hypothetical protein
MNLPELIIFLLVTSGVGALVGGIIGIFVDGFAKGAKLGAMFGPIAAGCIITVVVFICNLRDNNKKQEY